MKQRMMINPDHPDDNKTGDIAENVGKDLE
jgi:hypothetical protein